MMKRKELVKSDALLQKKHDRREKEHATFIEEAKSAVFAFHKAHEYHEKMAEGHAEAEKQMKIILYEHNEMKSVTPARLSNHS